VRKMESEKKLQSDHDLLLELNVKVADLLIHFTNHLYHHFLYTLAMFTALLSVIGGFVLYFLKI